MKTTLTVKESARLIELGVDPKMASNTTITDYDLDMVYYAPRFSVGDLINILPKEISDSVLGMEYDSEFHQWWVGYNSVSLKSAPELIDALNTLLIWCLEQKIIKLKED